MLRFLYVVTWKQSFDSSMDLGERANVGRPDAAGHLTRHRRSRERNTEKEQPTLGLVYFI
jgi:hypothetical protein